MKNTRSTIEENHAHDKHLMVGWEDFHAFAQNNDFGYREAVIQSRIARLSDENEKRTIIGALFHAKRDAEDELLRYRNLFGILPKLPT